MTKTLNQQDREDIYAATLRAAMRPGTTHGRLAAVVASGREQGHPVDRLYLDAATAARATGLTVPALDELLRAPETVLAEGSALARAASR